MIEGWEYYPDAPFWESEFTDEEIQDMKENAGEEKYQNEKEEGANGKT
jgi:hypothetical protein